MAMFKKNVKKRFIENLSYLQLGSKSNIIRRYLNYVFFLIFGF